MKYVLFTVKGLENSVLSELAPLRDCLVLDVSDKCIQIEYVGDVANLLQLRTVDDIAVLFDLSWESFEKAINTIKVMREIQMIFSLTFSLAKTDINKKDLETKMLNFCESVGLKYTETNRDNLDIRIFKNNLTELYAIRLNDKPLYKRSYDMESYLGALKSTIAASMVQESLQFSENTRPKLVDLFCGSGTILCEAYLAGMDVYGSDINSEGVRLTQRKLAILGNTDVTHVTVQDAFKTNWKSNSFDIMISNLPWDKQHKVSSISELYTVTIKEAQRILKDDYVLCLIVHKPEILIKQAKKILGDIQVKQIKLGYLGQTPTIVIFKKYL